MRDFDHNGLLLAEYQGKLFEKSAELDCSTGIFIRRYLHSDLLEEQDKNDPALASLSVAEGIDSITRQFGPTDYGKIKFSREALFWIGYMYRYISYTRDESTNFVAKLFSYKQMNELYFSYHTQDPEWCVRSLLELNGLTEDVFDKNLRLKEIMRKRNYLQSP